jgi:hypothetical protein
LPDLSDGQQQPLVVDSVGAVQRVTLTFAGIRRLSKHLVRKRVVEEEL